MIFLPELAAQRIMHCNCDAWGPIMKSSNFPSVRVDPSLRDAAEKVLESEESLSSFVEHSIRYQVQRRNLQRAFIARGLAAADEARRSGEYYSADDVLTELDQIIDAQRRR
jgi:predicted transcriptional regulator